MYFDLQTFLMISGRAPTAAVSSCSSKARGDLRQADLRQADQAQAPVWRPWVRAVVRGLAPCPALTQEWTPRPVQVRTLLTLLAPPPLTDNIPESPKESLPSIQKAKTKDDLLLMLNKIKIEDGSPRGADVKLEDWQ